MSKHTQKRFTGEAKTSTRSNQLLVDYPRVGVLASGLGARNADKTRLATPDTSGSIIYKAIAAGDTEEYKTRQGNTWWPTFYGFSNPRSISVPFRNGRIHVFTHALEKRIKRKGLVVS